MVRKFGLFVTLHFQTTIQLLGLMEYMVVLISCCDKMTLLQLHGMMGRKLCSWYLPCAPFFMFHQSIADVPPRRRLLATSELAKLDHRAQSKKIERVVLYCDGFPTSVPK